MKQHYNRSRLPARLRQLVLATALATGTAAGAAQAQALNYPLANAQNVAGTYTDLGTAGTAIATATADDANSAEQLIGFNFAYNGATMDRFILNTNGFLKLGSAAGMAAPTVGLYTAFAQFNSGGALLGTAATDVNLLAPFNYDLLAGTSPAEYRVATTGPAGSRVCTVQWKNVADKAQASQAGGASVPNQYANMTFQVKLYEANNGIEFVYGPNTPAAAANNNFKYAQVGVKGSGNGANQILRVTKGSVSPWGDGAVTFASGPVAAGATGAFNFRQSVPPDNGRTFRFAPTAANDVAAAAIQGFASVIVPATNPFTIRGVVRNAGTSAQTASTSVTLTISGANAYTQTQTVPALAVGAVGVATFSGITLPNVGQNTVTVSVPNDDNNFNSSYSEPMETSATAFSLATPNGASGGSVFSAGDDRYYAAKMTLSAARSITAVSALISDAGDQATAKTSVGESVYGVVINATTGALLARSPTYVITAADVNTIHTFTLSAPATVSAGDVLVGMAQSASSGALPYFPFGVQIEDPNRPDTYFTGSANVTSAPTAALNSTTQPNPTNIYKFPFGAVTAAPANSDIAVNEIQGYGSVAVPVGNPFSIRGVVRNAGIAPVTTPTVVTLTITGANTFSQTQTLASLAVSGTAVVNFTNISLTNVGANTVTVSVANDDNNGNNSVAQAMTTSATAFSFITPGVPQTSSFGFTPNAAARTLAFCGKFTVNTPRAVTAVRAVIGNDADLVPNAANGQRSTTVYGVVLNATSGALIARSPDYVVTAADLGQLHTFNLSGNVPAGDFLVGLAQVLPAGTGADAVFPMAYQAETPARTGLFFTANLTVPGAPTEASINDARYMLEAETAAPTTCLVPSSFAITGSTATSVSFSFTGVTGATGYQIVYGPQGFTPGTAG
ncbi:MAG TPA: hypothetical protein VF630_19900, partial [Hymenobacter sp.]